MRRALETLNQEIEQGAQGGRHMLAIKLQVWGPRLGPNAPKQVPIPEVMSGNTITLEGQALEVRGLEDFLPHRS